MTRSDQLRIEKMRLIREIINDTAKLEEVINELKKLKETGHVI